MKKLLVGAIALFFLLGIALVVAWADQRYRSSDNFGFLPEGVGWTVSSTDLSGFVELVAHGVDVTTQGDPLGNA